MTLQVVTAEAARLLLLGAQGLLSDPGRPATHAALQKLIEQMGFVQLDSINIVERAQHLTLASRLDNYRHDQLAHLLENRRSLFEQWTHDASAIPTVWFPHWKPRFRRARERLRRNSWWNERMGEEPERIIDEVRERIEREGPLRSQDFENERTGASSAWWGWKPRKAALEFLWTTGELTVIRREKFQKVYDLTQRVFPQQHGMPAPSEESHVEWACSTAFERLVVATPREIAQFWNAVEAVKAKAWCVEAERAGRIVPVLVEAFDGAKKPSYASADWERRLSGLPEPPARMRLLSPFDPVLRDRVRARRLFGFEYRFEAFVPEAQRRHGYYVLPILEGDSLVGRLDPKFHRDESVLRIRRVFREQGVRLTRARRKALQAAAERLAQFIGAERIEWPAPDVI